MYKAIIMTVNNMPKGRTPRLPQSHQRIWGKHFVDKNLKDEWIENTILIIQEFDEAIKEYNTW